MNILLYLSIGIFSFATYAVDIGPIDAIKGSNMMQAKTCELVVSFGSYAMGTSIKTEKLVIQYVKNSKTIKKAVSWSWGNEGESSLCLTLSQKDISKVFEDIKKMIPSESKKAWSSIEDQSGNVHRTTWPKK